MENRERANFNPTTETDIVWQDYVMGIGADPKVSVEDDGSLGAEPQQGPGAKPLVGCSGTKPPSSESWTLVHTSQSTLLEIVHVNVQNTQISQSA